MRITVPRDVGEVQVQVTGGETPSPTTILDARELNGSPTSLRLIDIVYAVEGGLKVFLWWDDADGESLILPLEGRGRLDLGPVGGITDPRNEGWTGRVLLTTEGKGSFFLGLEFFKIR